jgi:ABC-type uncharacterized transport system permease subunit
MHLKEHPRLVNFGFILLSIIASLALTTIMLLLVGAPPLETFQQIIFGIVGNSNNISNVLIGWIPLMIIVCGLLVTFAAGLWNIGIEGQVIFGAIFCTGILRALEHSTVSPPIIIILGIIAGIIGGGLWALLVGLLKTFGGVNEIFGGLGLDYVASTFILYLIYGPWRRPGIASLSGTQIFPPQLSLSTFPGIQFSPWALVLGVISVIIIFFLLSNTYIGLKLKALGKNIRGAFMLGVPSWQYMLLSFVVCGFFAGLAGALQVVAVFHRLLPVITQGYGFLGLLVAMLINYQAIWVAPIALFYAALNAGAIQLPIVLKLVSNLAGFVQGLLVLFVLLGEGIRQRYLKNL